MTPLQAPELRFRKRAYVGLVVLLLIVIGVIAITDTPSHRNGSEDFLFKRNLTFNHKGGDSDETEASPTMMPTMMPTDSPTKMPNTMMPTDSPTKMPNTKMPTASPTMMPSRMPVACPSEICRTACSNCPKCDSSECTADCTEANTCEKFIACGCTLDCQAR
jgi:hypothetical protein